MMEITNIQEFLNFLHKEGHINTQLFRLDPILDKSNAALDISPAGDYFIYQKDSYQPKFWAYNLSLLLEIVRKYGGMVTDKNNQLLYIKYPE